MAVDIKQVSRKILEDVFGKGKLEYLDQVCDASFKAHDPIIGEYDVQGLKREATMYRDSFPDLQLSIQSVCAEGDLVCVQWRATGTHKKALFGAQPTGKRTTVDGITMDRYRGGKLVESFTQWDTLGLLQQLGIAPKLDLGAAKGAPEARPHA